MKLTLSMIGVGIIKLNNQINAKNYFYQRCYQWNW